MSEPTWELMKLAFRYFARGFERIIFMILGAEIAFLLAYLFFSVELKQTFIPLLPAGYGVGGNTLSGAMVIAGSTAVVYTIWTLLTLAAIGMIIGYVRYFVVVLSYYDEEKYKGYIKYRSSKIPDWLMSFDIGKEAEQIRLATIEECKMKIKAIKNGY